MATSASASASASVMTPVSLSNKPSPTSQLAASRAPASASKPSPHVHPHDHTPHVQQPVFVPPHQPNSLSKPSHPAAAADSRTTTRSLGSAAVPVANVGVSSSSAGTTGSTSTSNAATSSSSSSSSSVGNNNNVNYNVSNKQFSARAVSSANKLIDAANKNRPVHVARKGLGIQPLIPKKNVNKLPRAPDASAAAAAAVVPVGDKAIAKEQTSGDLLSVSAPVMESVAVLPKDRRLPRTGKNAEFRELYKLAAYAEQHPEEYEKQVKACEAAVEKKRNEEQANWKEARELQLGLRPDHDHMHDHEGDAIIPHALRVNSSGTVSDHTAGGDGLAASEDGDGTVVGEEEEDRKGCSVSMSGVTNETSAYEVSTCRDSEFYSDTDRADEPDPDDNELEYAANRHSFRDR